MKRFFILLLTLLVPTVALAQTCNDKMLDTSPDANFSDNQDGTITDSTTGLVWMKCSLGQTFDASSNSCTGEGSQMTWQEALNTAHGYQFANLNGWRLPNIKELASITERSCVRPAINETFFPATPSDDFWTSTPSLNTLDSAWVVAFFNSSNALKVKNSYIYVRLVRQP